MYRLNTYKSLLVVVLLAGTFIVTACATEKPIVRDQLTIEKLRLRITKVRHAKQETRDVIAASRGAAYLPELYMRLAELLSEEARYHYMVAYEREQRSTKDMHVPQVRFLKEQAIHTYREILRKYPDTRLADRILFNISQEHRELGQFTEMKEALHQLIDEHGASRYRNEALLVLGDFHFDKSEFSEAKRYYSDIVKANSAKLRGLAHYKLAWVNVNEVDCKKALTNFEKAITSTGEDDGRHVGVKSRAKRGDDNNGAVTSDFAVPAPDENADQFAGHQSVDVAREALVDLTYCYARERKPEKAVSYLKKLASTREAYVAALVKMANRYAMIEQPLGAAAVARELLRLAPDETERLDDARMLHTAVSRMKDYSQVGEDVRLILRAFRRQTIRPNLEGEDLSLAQKEFELIARDLATKSHGVLNAENMSEVSKWTKEPANAAQTAYAYINYLNAFPASPHRVEVLQNLADVLMESHFYLEAGHRYSEIARLLEKPAAKVAAKDNDGGADIDENPYGEKANKKKVSQAKDSDDSKAAKEQEKVTPEQRDAMRRNQRIDALYDAVVAYQKSLNRVETRTHFERVTARAGLRANGGDYLNLVKTGDEKSKKLKFAIAQSYYDEGNYINAIDLLTAIAYEFAGTEQGDAAIHMVLDSYRTINDISGLINAGRRFLSDAGPASATIKKQIAPIVAAAEQNRLDELSLAASGEQVGGMDVLMAFAERYKNTDLGERALLSAFVAARASGKSNELYQLGDKIVKQFPGSEQASGVVSTMGRAAAARFEFDKAVAYLEKSAKMNETQRASLLIAAGQLREQLADFSGARKNYQDAYASAGDGPVRNEAVVRLVHLMEQTESAKKLISKITSMEQSGDAEIESVMGIALLRVGRHMDAEEYFLNVNSRASEISQLAKARADFGMAEIMLNMLESYQPPDDIAVIEELVGVIDVTVQSYMSAARQGDPVYTQAALARLARTTEVGAGKLENVTLPASLSEDERVLVQEAMSARAAQLRADTEAVLAECAQRAKRSFLLNAAARYCIQGKTPKEIPLDFYPLKKRGGAAQLKGQDEMRERLSKNPDDLEALQAVGTAFLESGDAHAARIVLARTVEAGGDASDLNEFGVACYGAGDTMGALDAFRRAKEAGSQAAILNLARIAQEQGLADFAAELKDSVSGDVSGSLITASSGGGK